jgi:mono/diheme cytochrome c family protein
MLKRLLLLALSLVVAAGFSGAAQSQSKVVIPVQKTSPTDGKVMYQNYCAPCHGVDGKGNGPVASELRTRPTNLTLLSKKNQGKFPDIHIASVLRFGTKLPAHGTEQMPVWGPILGKMNQMNAMDKQLRISNLSSYIESLQVK